MNGSDSTGTKWSLQHPSFDDGKQLKLMVVKDCQTNDLVWRMVRPEDN